MTDTELSVQSIEQAAIDPPRGRVFLRMKTTLSALVLELPLDLLPRLVALCLHAIGKSEVGSTPETVALQPEGMEVCVLADGQVGLRLILPGGAPLTFMLEPADACALGASLASAGASQPSEPGAVN
jgi:hypothetical protein